MICPTDPIEMHIEQVVVLGMNMPAITYDEFFDEEHIVLNVALLLGVDPRNVSACKNHYI